MIPMGVCEGGGCGGDSGGDGGMKTCRRRRRHLHGAQHPACKSVTKLYIICFGVRTLFQLVEML